MIQTISEPCISVGAVLQDKAIEPSWKQTLKKHDRPSFGRSSWQVINTLGPYVALWPLMAWTSQRSWWFTLPMIVVAAGLLVRTFIIFHDCTHGSFFQSRRANTILGFITGVLTFTSFHHLHHLSPAIPNYNLERCHKEHSAFQQVTTINLWTSLRSLSLRLWDEQSQQLIGYRELRKITACSR